jgi:transcription-repair coupling factor (superfamily II helicase)
MYKRIAGVENEQQLAEVGSELTDRYGPTPPPVRTLMQYASLLLLSRRLGISGIDRRKDQITIRFSQQAAIDPELLARFVASERGSQFFPSGILKFTLRATNSEEVVARLKELLLQLAGDQVRVA